jgi:hypothetical protein
MGVMLCACTLSIADVEPVPDAPDGSPDFAPGPDKGTVTPGNDASPDASADPMAVDSGDAGAPAKDVTVPEGDASVDVSPPDTAGVDAGGSSIRFVQIAYVECPTKTTCSLPLPAPVTAGDTMIVSVALYLTPTATVSDSLGNAYTFVVGPADDPSYRSYIAAAYNTPGGANTVSVAASTRTDIYIWAAEYSGITGFDVEASTTGNGTSVASPNLTTTGSDELLYGYAGYFYGGTVDPSFTFRSTGGLVIVEDRIAPTAGSYRLTGTQYGSGTWTANLAAFKGR